MSVVQILPIYESSSNPTYLWVLFSFKCHVWEHIIQAYQWHQNGSFQRI